MTDSNVLIQETATDCRVCGNVLALSDVACSRCKSTPALSEAAWPPSEPMPEEVFPDRSDDKPTRVNSPYRRASTTDASTFPLARARSRQTKLVAAALAALTALIAGASYLYSVSSHDNREATPGAGALAEGSLSVAPQTDSIIAPVPAKNSTVNTTQTIDTVRSDMVRGELNTARQQLTALAPGGDQRADVRRITDELVQREHARDSALGLARVCEKAGDMPCVLRSAGDALASDLSNSEARGMLLRALTQSGTSQVTAANATAVASVNAANVATVNQRVDAPAVTHRKVTEKRRLRHERQIVANGNDVYGRH